MEQQKFKVVKNIAVVGFRKKKVNGINKDETLELRQIKWLGHETPVYDLRWWSGNDPGKGTTMTLSQLAELGRAIDDIQDFY